MPDSNFMFITGVNKASAGQHIAPGQVCDMRNLRADTGSLVKRPGISRLRDLDMGLGALYWPLVVFDFPFDFANADWGAMFGPVIPPEGVHEWADVPGPVWDDHPVVHPPGWDEDAETTIDVSTEA